MSSERPLLRARGVRKYFPVRAGVVLRRTVAQVHAVDGVDLDVHPGETLGLVGETGCGKSTLARCLARLYPLSAGRVEFDGHDLSTLSPAELRPHRRQLQMIFQDPYGSLNPRRRVGSIIGDPFAIHGVDRRADRRRRVQDLMERVGLNPEHYNRFPSDFSGGQRQRIGIARALAVRPAFIVCDEPVSALDVSIQAQVIILLERLRDELNLTYLFIAHDLSVVRNISDRVAVMYLGRIVEITNADEIYANPLHPYTVALLSAVPIPDPAVDRTRERIILAGDVPSPINPPRGCNFNPRCAQAMDICREEVPELRNIGGEHWVACHLVK